MNKKFIKTKNQKSQIRRSANRMEIDSFCSNFYNIFEKFKKPFILCFDNINNEVDFDNFMPLIENQLKIINKKILIEIFDNNLIEWEMSDTEDYILKCFFKYKNENTNIIENGKIINLFLYEQDFDLRFCSYCKTILVDKIKQRVDYLTTEQRYCENIISINGSDCVRELEDLKDYISDINTEQDYLRFGDKYLNKKELIIFSFVLSKIFKENQSTNKQYVMKELNLSDSNYKKLIMSIKKKYNQYKIDYKI